MDQPILVQRLVPNNYPMPGHIQRAQTAPMSREGDMLFSSNDLKRATSPGPSASRIPISHSRGTGSSYSNSNTPRSITPSATPPLVVNGVPLTSGTALNKIVPRSTPSIAPSTTSTTSTVSLYQTSIALRDRLQGVPGFQHFLELTEKPNSTDPEARDDHMDTLDLDVVSHLWRCFMLGPSLCCIYNALDEPKKLEINEDCTLADLKECKKAVYHFLVAVKDILPAAKLFSISDLYNNNTNGIVKVVTTVTALLDILEDKGLLIPVESPSTMDPLDNPIGSRQKVIKELITTEREYVGALERLMDFRNELQAKNLLNSDTIHLLFANLPQLVEFQRRFLIGVEVLVTLPEEKQQFGSLFTRMEEGFEVYEPFCANFAYANELALEETKNGTLGQLSNLDDPQHQFGSLLIKPVQRICKYPLLLKQLLRYTDQAQNPHLYAELEAGIASIERVTSRVNETKREQENLGIAKELETRIVNWKEIDRHKLGNLLLTETFPVLMGDKERHFQCFLFQKMFMCCRDDSLNGKDGGRKAAKTMSMSKKSKNGRLPRDSSVPAKSPLQIKGRLYIRDIRDIYIPQDRSTGTTPFLTALTLGAYFITIRYRPEDTPEVPIILRPRNEETMLKWYNTLKDLHNKVIESEGESYHSSLIDEARSSQRNTMFSAKSLSFSNGNSRSKFEGRIDVSAPLHSSGSGSDDGQDDGLRSQPMSRNASNMSDRGYEAPGYQIPRKPAPNRFPLNPHGPPPHSRSGSLGVATDFQGSYFSPMVETPPVPSISPHTSQHQYPFPSSLRNDDLNMARSSSKDSYSSNGIPTPPLTAKLPERSSRPSIAPLNTSRSRSASTPNIHQIQTNVARGRELHPPLPINRRERDSGHSGSPVTPHSPISPITSSRPTTGTSTYTTAFSSIPETPSSASSTSTSATRKAVPSTPGSSTGSLDKTSALKVKITYGNDMFVVVVPSDVTYAALVQKVRHKLSVCSNVARDGPLRMKYQDEDGDLVTISSDEDVALAVESRAQHIPNSGNAGFAGAGVINLLVYSSSI